MTVKIWKVVSASDNQNNANHNLKHIKCILLEQIYSINESRITQQKSKSTIDS